jgi:hypothetical protein
MIGDRTLSSERRRPALIAGLFLVLAAVPACNASAGHALLRKPGQGGVAVSPSPYVAYRPAYEVPGTKPLYLSSYAGSNYPSVAPGAVVTPTAFRAMTGKPARPRWFPFGGGW